MEILAYIIDEIGRAHNQVVDPAQEHPELYFWGMLQAWEIQQRYLDNRFLDDPALSGILVRRALLRKSEGTIKLEKELEVLKKDMRGMQTMIAQLKKKAGLG